MKYFVNILLIQFVILSVVFSGCELFTNPKNQSVDKGVGEDLIISEVFTIPLDKYYAYSWIELYNPSRRTFTWYEQSRPAIGLIVGENGVMFTTTDDGQRWQPLNGPTANTLRSVFFPLPDTGLVVGDEGMIVKVGKSGNVFTAMDFSHVNPDTTFQNLNDIAFYVASLDQPPSRSGYIVGDKGLILKTTDRGNKWVTFTGEGSRVPYNLRSLGYEGLGLIWAVGDSGTIIKSSGSNVWSKKTPPENHPKTNFTSCAFFSDTGWVIGDSGVIAFTKTGGAIFVAQNVPLGVETKKLNDIFFGKPGGRYNKYTGWVVGDGGLIMKTTNRGEEWQVVESGTTNDLYNVFFKDSLNGVAFGANGTFCITVNGGEGWFAIDGVFGSGAIYGSYFNQARLVVRSKYVLEMLAKRKEFFLDVTTGTVNFDVITKADTGYLIYDPYLISQEITREPLDPIPPNYFVVLNNDSIRFKNHTKLGPGNVTEVNASIAYYFDLTVRGGARGVLWDLLSSGEIRLVKYDETFDVFTNEFLNFKQRIVDVVRWGNYTVPDSTTYNNQLFDVWPQGGFYVYLPYQGNSPRFDQNISSGFITEWYSLARYANDVGYTDATGTNTSTSFFLAKEPIPGWYSQRKK